MKKEKLPSGSYRIRKQKNGIKYTLVFDHKPTQNEIDEELSIKYSEKGLTAKKTMLECALGYIDSKNNILSPSTIRSYNTMVRSMSPAFANISINKIESVDVQNEINNYSINHSAKSVKNYHGFISAIIKMYRPNMSLHTTLPKNRPNEAYRPSEDDIKALLDASNGTKYHIVFQLGVLGLRRGEILGLDFNTDLKGNELHIHQVLCEGPNGFVYKDMPKNETSNRKIYLPDALVEEIQNQGFIYNMSPNMILQTLHRYQDLLGLPHFRFHDLRHYFASYAHSIGIPDVYIKQMGGWKSDYTLNKVYKEAMASKSKEIKKEVAAKLLH